MQGLLLLLLIFYLMFLALNIRLLVVQRWWRVWFWFLNSLSGRYLFAANAFERGYVDFLEVEMEVSR